MNKRRALMNFTLMLSLLLGLGLISLLDLPGWRAQASHGSFANQTAGQSAARGAAAHKLLNVHRASAPGKPELEPALVESTLTMLVKYEKDLERVKNGLDKVLAP